MRQNGGCTKYVQATVRIHFTGDTVCCGHCPLLETYSRDYCRLTGEYILDKKTQGIWCPFEDYKLYDMGGTDGS